MTCCAWCGDELDHGPRAPATAQAAPVSHGMCRPCLDHQLAALDRRPAFPRGAWTARPALAQASGF